MGGLGKARIPSKKKPKNGPGGTLRLIALQIDELGLWNPKFRKYGKIRCGLVLFSYIVWQCPLQDVFSNK